MSSANPLPVPPRVLSVSRDVMLLACRNAVLRQAGYVVETTMNDENALEIVRRGSIDVVVLGDSISPTQRSALTQAIRQINSKLPVIVLKLSSETPPSEATAWMDSLDGPQILLAKLQEVLRSTGAQAA